jgi:hypothetical protein
MSQRQIIMTETSSTFTRGYHIPVEHPFYRALCWKAILAGAVAAMALHILLCMLGVAGGLTLFTPVTDTDPVAHFSIGAAIIWNVCAIVALFFGGVMAGRFSNSPHSGFAHGILVWSVTVIIAMGSAVVGTGMMTAGAAKILGDRNNIVGGNLNEVLKENNSRLKDELTSFVDEVVPPSQQSGEEIGLRRQLTEAVGRMFRAGADMASKENRAALNSILGGMVRNPDVLINRWVAEHQQLQADLKAAEQRARVEADRVAGNLASVAIWMFFALLVGMLAAALGGVCGAKCAMRHVHEQFLVVE